MGHVFGALNPGPGTQVPYCSGGGPNGGLPDPAEHRQVGEARHGYHLGRLGATGWRSGASGVLELRRAESFL